MRGELYRGNLGLAFFVITMATFWQILNIENRNKLAEFYEEKFGKAFLPPRRHEERVRVQGKLESLKEIDKLMKQAPNCTIDKQGREG